MSFYKREINDVKSLETQMHGKDFLLTWDKTDQELRATLAVANILKKMHSDNISAKLFNSGLALSIFRDQSTRTRYSFASATNFLGLTVSDLDEGKSQIAHGETVRETANMISFLTEIIGIRDDMYLGAGNSYMQEVGRALDDGFERGLLNQRPGVINLQCDIDHPTQSMADLLHLKNHFGSLEALKGKKIAMTWAYSPSYGKPLSVPQGIIGLMTRFGMNVVLAHPPGYNLMPECIDIARNNAQKSQGAFMEAHSMEEAFEGADIVYPKSWAPFDIMKQRTELLKAKDGEGLKNLEKKCLEQNAAYQNWECDRKKMNLTKDKKALYMHCLPADISGVSCKAGEVSAEVFEASREDTYREAGYKPFIIASMILLNRFANPSEILENLLKNAQKRVEGI